MKHALAALTLITLGYLAGTLAPRASADSLGAVVSELKSLRGELAGIRRAVEKAGRR